MSTLPVRTFGDADRETALLWRCPARADGTPSAPFFRARTPVVFVLDRRSAAPWFAFDVAPGVVDLALAPAPYLGALSTVLSDLLTEEEL